MNELVAEFVGTAILIIFRGRCRRQRHFEGDEIKWRPIGQS
ncbi:hypothetical protein ACFPFV_12610 [Salinicoccus siamensis]